MKVISLDKNSNGISDFLSLLKKPQEITIGGDYSIDDSFKIPIYNLEKVSDFLKKNYDFGNSCSFNSISTLINSKNNLNLESFLESNLENFKLFNLEGKKSFSDFSIYGLGIVGFHRNVSQINNFNNLLEYYLAHYQKFRSSTYDFASNTNIGNHYINQRLN